MSGIRLQTFDAEQAQKIVDDLVEVYLDVHGGPDDAFHNEDRYRRQLAGHMSALGWKLVTATRDGALTGYAYGFPLPPTTRWWHGLQTPVPDDFTEEDGRRTFAISEIMVRVPWRRQGLAQALHSDLMAGQPEERVTLLVEPGNAAAQAAYAKWGYRKVAKVLPDWENAPRYDVMIRPL